MTHDDSVIVSREVEGPEMQGPARGARLAMPRSELIESIVVATGSTGSWAYPRTPSGRPVRLVFFGTDY